MPTPTQNFGFLKVEESDTVPAGLAALNNNFNKLDGMPLPFENGSNSQLQYFKFSNGLLLMWGRIKHGNAYLCNEQVGSGWYFSSQFDLFWPISLVDPANASVLMMAHSVNYPDLQILVRESTAAKARLNYAFPQNENWVPKEFSVFVMGRWK
jgi:hypothetical protein